MTTTPTLIDTSVLELDYLIDISVCSEDDLQQEINEWKSTDPDIAALLNAPTVDEDEGEEE